MFGRKSRYANARSFAPTDDGREVFGGVRPRSIGSGTGVIEHRIQEGDRLDLLARHYYNNDRLWWRIVDANPEFDYAGDIVLEQMHGQTILIPKATE